MKNKKPRLVSVTDDRNLVVVDGNLTIVSVNKFSEPLIPVPDEPKAPKSKTPKTPKKP